MAQTHLVRFWHHDDKWDATRGTFMFYIGRLKAEAEQQFQSHKETSNIAKMKERAAKFFTIMYNRRLQSGQAFNEDPDVKRVIKGIKKKYYDEAPARLQRVRPSPPVTGPAIRLTTVTDSTAKASSLATPAPSASSIITPAPSSSSIATPDPWPTVGSTTGKAKSRVRTEPYPATAKPPGLATDTEPSATDGDNDTDIDNVETGENWEPCLPLRRVGEYIQNLLEASLAGQPLEVIQITNHERCRNGFVSLCRLADVYGRGLEQDAMGPTNFRWGISKLHKDWAQYKIMIEGSGYLRQYEGFDPIVCGSARRGFTKYNDHKRLTDWLRTVVDEHNPQWDPFKNAVDKFLGDIHRTEYNEAAINNHNGLMAMDTSAVLDMTPLKVHNVKRYVPFAAIKAPEFDNKPSSPSSGDKSSKKPPGNGKQNGNQNSGKNNSPKNNNTGNKGNGSKKPNNNQNNGKNTNKQSPKNSNKTNSPKFLNLKAGWYYTGSELAHFMILC